MLGLMKLNIEVAGGGNEPEVMLAGIKEDEAKHLISLLHKERNYCKRRNRRGRKQDGLSVNSERGFSRSDYIWSVRTSVLWTGTSLHKV